MIKRESKEYYEKAKHDVMDDESLKLSEKYIDYYKSSWNDKDQRGLFDLWEKVEDYWEGDVNLPESDADPGSNTNIIHPTIEGQVALLVEQNIAIEPEPVEISDKPFSDAAKIMLEWVKEKNKMKRKMDVHERRREKFGTGIFMITFDPKFMNGFGLPMIDPLNPAYVFIDPNITDIYKHQDGRFEIITINRSIYWAKQKFGAKAEAIIPGHHPLESEWIFGEDDGENDEISRDNYLHMLVYTKDKGKLRLVEMSGCGVILSDSNKDKRHFPNDKYPLFLTPLYFREGTVWGKGDAELLINSQDLINDIDDQIRINARLSGNPQKLVSTSSGIDIEKWTNEPGLNIPCTEVSTAYQPVIPPPMAQYPIERRKYAIEYESGKISRYSDQMNGIRQKGVDTATEALALQQSANNSIAHKKLLLQETLGEMFEYILEMIKEYYTEEQSFQITGKKNEFFWFRGSDLKKIPKLIPASQEFRRKFEEENPGVPIPQYMASNDKSTKEAMFDIKVTVGAGLPSNKAFVYQVISEAFAKGAITIQEFRKLLREYVALPVEENPPAPPRQPQQGVTETSENPNVQGMSMAGNPAAMGMLGGG